MTTIAIVTSTPVGGIGINDRLPWLNLSILKDNYDELAKDAVVLAGKNAVFNHDHVKGEIIYVYTREENPFQETDTLKKISGDPNDVINELQERHPGKNIIIGGGEGIFSIFYDYIDEWRVTIIDEFVVYNRDLNLADITARWSKHRLVASGVDLNQSFSTWHYSNE